MASKLEALKGDESYDEIAELAGKGEGRKRIMLLNVQIGKCKDRKTVKVMIEDNES